MGDQHPWAISDLNTEFHEYRALISRFPNEGGVLGPTALPTVLSCLPEGLRDPDAAAFPQDYKAGAGAPGEALRALAWDTHENASTFGGPSSAKNRMIEKWLGRSVLEMTVAEFVYRAGLVQGMGFHEYIRNFRRRMFSSAAAIFWMYNDCWPAIRSWTIVDYYQRRTPSFHPVRRAFAPTAVFIAVEEGKVKIFGVNEGPAWEGELRYGVVALAGGYPRDEMRGVTLPANASTLLAEFDVAAWEALGQTSHIRVRAAQPRWANRGAGRVFPDLLQGNDVAAGRGRACGMRAARRSSRAMSSPGAFASTWTARRRCPTTSSIFCPAFLPSSTGPPRWARRWVMRVGNGA